MYQVVVKTWMQSVLAGCEYRCAFDQGALSLPLCAPINHVVVFSRQQRHTERRGWRIQVSLITVSLSVP